MYNSLSYFALLDLHKSPGVDKKVNDLLQAAKNINIDARKEVFPTSFSGVLMLIKSLISCESDVIYIRFSDFLFPFLFLFLIYLRLKGKKIIIDVPTPRIICINEIDMSLRNFYLKFFRKTISYISSSWVLFPSNLIIQYADEHFWFSFGVKGKTLKMGNGILVDKYIPSGLVRTKPTSALNLIAVAQLSDWHGYDRLINALAIINQDTNIFNLTIVGDGEALEGLKLLAKKLSLDNVTFTGRLVGADLDRVFETADIGVASLGLYRIGLSEASVLKTREYMARGLPVITAGYDPDFSGYCPFRFSVSNSDEIDSIVECLNNMSKMISTFSVDEVHDYAKKNLSIDSKLKIMLEKI